MPPFAVCSNKLCTVCFDIQEDREGPTRMPPEKCPSCQMPLLWFCPACHWPLNEKPSRKDPRCPNCKSTLPATLNNCSISSNEDENMPYALCSNSKCYFNIELHDRKNGHPIETPLECPRCKSSRISTCPECGILLMGSPGATECALCKADIRLVFAKWHGRAQ